MGKLGTAPKITSISGRNFVARDPEYYLHSPRDTVVVLPGDPDAPTGRGSVIRVTFPKAGRFNWHCHILSHEDHEMMRVMQVIDKTYPDRVNSEDEQDFGEENPDSSDFNCQCDCQNTVPCECTCQFKAELDPSNTHDQHH